MEFLSNSDRSNFVLLIFCKKRKKNIIFNKISSLKISFLGNSSDKFLEGSLINVPKVALLEGFYGGRARG